VSDSPFADSFEQSIAAGIAAALRKRAAVQREKAADLITVIDCRGSPVTVVPSEARGPMRIAADWDAIAAELEAEGRSMNARRAQERGDVALAHGVAQAVTTAGIVWATSTRPPAASLPKTPPASASAYLERQRALRMRSCLPRSASNDGAAASRARSWAPCSHTASREGRAEGD
jgi:hypothetical protein